MNWHVIRDPNDPELDALAARYHLHPLHLEDCRHRNQSAKIEEHEDYVFVVLKPVSRNPGGELEICDLDLIFGRDFLITVEEGGECKVGPIIDRVRAGAAARMDQAVYRVIDAIVDSYLPLIDDYNDRIDDLEDLVLENPTPRALSDMFETKRGLIQVRRVLANTRDVSGHLLRTENDLIGRDLWPFLRDIYDHLTRELDLVETERDLLNGALDIYLSSVANRTNQVIKVLTVLGTVTLPAVVISSLYGMNVEGLPWKSSPYAFWIVVGLIAAISLALLVWMLRIDRGKTRQ